MAMHNAVLYEVVGEYEYQETEILQVLEYDDEEISPDQLRAFVKREYGRKVQVLASVPTERLVIKTKPVICFDDPEGTDE